MASQTSELTWNYWLELYDSFHQELPLGSQGLEQSKALAWQLRKFFQIHIRIPFSIFSRK